MKRPGDPCTLSVLWWQGPPPESGDGLQTRTGRRYLVLQVKRRRDGTVRALECLVLAKDETINGRVYEWEWGKRERRRT